ncbi:Retrovirus-related Pol polyprotein from transposon TNT 1-94 [Symbiodinium microadriaticum]|uniref:Retrovirus-related Pol polyprotein from transposon TNT 1-94 n=1 Tax=Symbiodinium microadriaticum TaxID=2951 RepID=A0A1Q9EBC4_SYMMI|nr:Retrovirus-related Pol polyprotein from transposon TNT 1-94 [Symbiodinium microadriaticum]
MLGDSRTVYVLLGTYAFGNHYGLTSHTRTFPQLSKYLNKFMENWSGGPFCRSSLVISWNNLLPLHRDVNNDSRYLNHMIGLGDYQHGELWLQSSESAEAGRDQRRQLPNGEWIRGRLWDVKGKVVKFAPNKWHQTQKWSGERITLTAFVSRGVHHLNESERARAKSCGFVLPPPEPTRVSTNKEEALAAESQQKAEEERIMKQLYLLHSATGHGSVKTMIDALKRRGASQRVLDLASRFVCSACQERKRPPPRRLASLEVLPPRWQTITADVGHWTHPQSGETVQFMLVIDEGSRFRIAKVLSRGSRQQPSAATCLAYLREAWFQVFGRPDVLRLDPAGSFRGQQAEDFCDRHSVYLDVIAADAHWQIGVCENAIKGVKHVMERVCACDEQLTAEEALALAIEVFNSREQVRGFTPIQHAFGRNPDVTGRLISRPEQIPEEALVENAHEDFARQAQMRADAEKALCDWQARQRISRAMHSRFLGPARILAMEGRREADGSHRPASPREELLESLAASNHGDGTPWTFNRLAEEIGGNRFEDITGERPTTPEWHRAQNPDEEAPPPRFRVRGKRAAPEEAEDAVLGHIQEDAQAAWWTIPEGSFSSCSSFWTDPAAAVEVAIELPESQRGLQSAVKNLSGYFVSALKRRAVEVSEKRLSEGDKELFREAKAVEVKNFVASRAFEALPPEARPDKSQAMGMRWILTWKTRDDGTQKAKARAVLLGYQDPSYAHRSTTSPVMTRQSRQMLLQTAAIRKWSVYKGDVSGAFLQGRDYPERLLCLPCDEICSAMNLPAGSVVRLRKACYGLVDAPLEWYRTVSEFLVAQGMERCWSDACTWVLRKEGHLIGVVSGHVDDFLFSGNEQSQEWNQLVKAIQDRFRWGDWDKDNFVQCGVQVNREGNCFKLSQPAYVESIPEIPVSSHRRKYEKDAPTTAQEKSKLRGKSPPLGGAERKSNLELLSVKEAQIRTALQVRWVHSEAQLGNSLTKQNGGHELELFSRMGQAWRIVEDPAMRSARKRKADGVPPLASHDKDDADVFEESEQTSMFLFQDHFY